MLYFLLINVKMPILTFTSRKISCTDELSMNIFITSGPDFAHNAGHHNIFNSQKKRRRLSLNLLHIVPKGVLIG